MAQTPQQKKANEKYAKHEAAKHGKGKIVAKSKPASKSPVSTGWLVILAFVVCGGIFLEILGIIPKLWSAVVASFNRLVL
ncbi:hypothetical protein BO70DRAFT_367059 [Aspergillus heteromorphus CBS 117.55]|uniref:Stress-associated endoplasmic reticulum protein n=1 Tax=Aspergillus heteromorphus CBS 117.55 TaxID=1448321 RepID=A0A317UQG2_9EURO|nr:uncharacterized protein BO70DRAFT_367059 [Aspergillus heteromorphus CBS 117.55]PWY64243.1 hypothetical protein BO70DRAFT_367059 [Aspergillus heteromorphus CBS 117.55]